MNQPLPQIIIPATFVRMCIDEYPNQPEFVDWPMSEEERIEMQTLETLADDGVFIPKQ